MKNKLTWKMVYIVLLGGLMSGCQEWVGHTRKTEQPPDQSPTPDIFEPFKANLIPDYYSDLYDLQNASVYTIKIQVDDTFTFLTGKMDIRYTNQENEGLDQIYFNLIPNTSGNNLDIKEVIIQGKPVLFSLENKNTTMCVQLDSTLQPMEAIGIAISFSLRVPEVRGGNYGLLIYQDDILALDSFFPIIPVYQDGNWQVEDPPANADMIFTDVAFFIVTVDSPKSLVWVASGVQDEVLHKGDRQIITFLAGPQRDFYLAASNHFKSRSLYVDGTLVTSYYPAGLEDAGLLVLDTAINALNIFNQRFGQYPFTELDLVSTPMNAGGMEYSGAMALSLDYYEDDILEEGNPSKDFLESATAHEIAHQWFFNQVMNDQIDEPWLDEGMAQYATYLYYLDAYGGSVADIYRQSWNQRWSRVGNQPIPVVKPAEAYTQREYSAIIYGRAPILIGKVADTMGESAFNEFIKTYVESNRWGIVDGQEFLKNAETSCACNLEPLYINWVLQ